MRRRLMMALLVAVCRVGFASAADIPEDEHSTVLLGGRTIRIDVSSGWHFSTKEARDEADQQLFDTLWPLARSVDPELVETQRLQLSALWLSGTACRVDRIEQRSRAYGSQVRQVVELTLSTDDLSSAVTNLRRQHRSKFVRGGLAGGGLLFLFLLSLTAAAWWDRHTKGYRRSRIACSLAALVLTELTAAGLFLWLP